MKNFSHLGPILTSGIVKKNMMFMGRNRSHHIVPDKIYVVVLKWKIDPRGRRTVTACSDHYLVYVRPSVLPTFKNLAKQNKFQVRIVIVTGGTVCLAEGVIDDTHNLSRLIQSFLPKIPDSAGLCQGYLKSSSATFTNTWMSLSNCGPVSQLSLSARTLYFMGGFVVVGLVLNW